VTRIGSSVCIRDYGRDWARCPGHASQGQSMKKDTTEVQDNNKIPHDELTGGIIGPVCTFHTFQHEICVTANLILYLRAITNSYMYTITYWKEAERGRFLVLDNRRSSSLTRWNTARRDTYLELSSCKYMDRRTHGMLKCARVEWSPPREHRVAIRREYRVYSRELYLWGGGDLPQVQRSIRLCPLLRDRTVSWRRRSQVSYRRLD